MPCWSYVDDFKYGSEKVHNCKCCNGMAGKLNGSANLRGAPCFKSVILNPVLFFAVSTGPEVLGDIFAEFLLFP